MKACPICHPELFRADALEAAQAWFCRGHGGHPLRFLYPKSCGAICEPKAAVPSPRQRPSHCWHQPMIGRRRAMLPVDLDGGIDYGLACLASNARPGEPVSVQEIASVTGRTAQEIWEIEQRALGKVESGLRSVMSQRELALLLGGGR